MKSFEIIAELCIGCGKCKNVCPFNAVEEQGKKIKMNSRCTGCEACISLCPREGAIALKAGTGTSPAASSPESGNAIAIMIEFSKCRIHDATLEILYAALELKEEHGGEVCAMVITDDMELMEEIAAFPFDSVWQSGSASTSEYNYDGIAFLFAAMARAKKPDIILGAATVFGRSVMPRVAALLETGLTADCTRLSYDKAESLLHQVRPAFGGHIMADIITPVHKPQMATIRPKTFIPACKSSTATDLSKIIEKIDLPGIPVSGTSVISVSLRKIPLFQSVEIIIAVGNGIKSAGNLKIFYDLAQSLGAEIGASRAAVDKGWLPQDRQIGLSGQTVRSVIYIAFGISGAVQHLAGMENCGLVIAVNTDPGAPIFNYSDFGIIADAVETAELMVSHFSAHPLTKEVCYE